MGSCAVDGACVSSPNYPGQYPDGEGCIIQVAPLDPERPLAIDVVDFSTEWSWDLLTVNGVDYSGTNGPEGVLPTGNITWNADA
ncbi:unnamed protein product [Symbiodinium natans]|uniref:CUB domain-containing protein n=1 Tax=Symbiodinium natans TaxID=878477 RepID=A0A812JBW6_9DINO|nr:unnamed protein product [Symbiodinium natans]